MSKGAAEATAAGATYRMLRELGSRSQHSFAAIREPSELLVVQRFARTPAAGRGANADLDGAVPVDAEAMALMLRDARCLAKNWHPNVARVRHVDLASTPQSVLTIASDFVDGATLEDLVAAAQPAQPAQPAPSAQRAPAARGPILPLPILARILLDVLAGLHALHGLRDGMNAPLGAMHGELCPANVVVGKDGVARIVNVLRKRPFRVRYGSEAVGHAAPEALDAAGTDDPRSDVYAVGVMLWEGLAGRRLTSEPAPGRILTRQREGELARPSIDASSPFAPLADVALRALSFDPSLRYRAATDMAADIRQIVGPRLASGASVATCVAELAGERIRSRRAVLEPAASGTRRRASERSIAAAEEDVVARAVDPGAVVAVRSLPPLPPPVVPARARQNVRRETQQPRTRPHVHADDRVETVPEARYDERPTMPAPAPADANAPEAAAPVVEVEVELDAEPETASAETASAENLIAAALSGATAKMRAVAFERAAGTPVPPDAAAHPPTPGDFVIPIEVTATWNEGAQRSRRRRLATVVVLAAALLAIATVIGWRAHATARPRGTPSLASPPTAVLPAAPDAPSRPSGPSSAQAVAPNADGSGPGNAVADDATAPAAPSSAGRAAGRAGVPAVEPRAPGPAKPKKSIYEPDGL